MDTFINKLQRSYQPGDEIQINNLYKLITGRKRSNEEYVWEWINTWDGMGEIWLYFDKNRKPNDQLIAQYSLIPTPLSIFGETYISGKTENCMSHPDIRGHGLYFPHESKYFNETKKRFKVFFTTTGHVAKGAPGKIRQKLGYRAFDDWVSYRVFCRNQNFSIDFNSLFPSILTKNSIIKKMCELIFSAFLRILPRQNISNTNGCFKIYDDSNIPLKLVENLWNQNKTSYGITVDRSESYLKWRLVENPYHNHMYVCYFEKGKLIGYAVMVAEQNSYLIIDLFANKNQPIVLKKILITIKHLASKNGIFQVKCNTLKRNKCLARILKSAGFFNPKEILNKFIMKKSKKPSQFFVYISKEINIKGNPWNHNHWYVTDLLKEGRPYTERRNS